ncbi:cation:proton antiporter [Minwuia thermotolerans]|uniref:Sodium:proton antiporter n=1 Tax=Minwuia thermotolerans TaxID=2056226 RepID=A0A2M9FVH9_9PROT|nr:cation:proton antiporter [Minwuia thermotolerans]PJK27475.1 sodium:proton antiporter [Minwuia thermotolerans]
MELATPLVTFGLLLLVGLALDALGRLTRLPRITLLVLFGLVIGPSALDILPVSAEGWLDTISVLALTMIAFLLGGELAWASLRTHGRAILAVSLSVMTVSFAVMAAGLTFAGAPPVLALLLAGIALATDPAATREVVREIRADGPATTTLLGVVAIDDAWGVIVFSVVLGFVGPGGIVDGLGDGLVEVFGAIGLGLAIGLPAALLTGRVRPGEPTLAEALGLVLLCAGMSLWLEISFLLTGMTTGAVIVNLARHHNFAFHEIEHISGPVLVLFFVLAGAAVDLSSVIIAGPLGLAFLLLRLGGRVGGGWLGGRLGGMPDSQARMMGLTLLPQAGVALGMALVASVAVPEHAVTVTAVTVATTVVFELLGPIVTRLTLIRLGEAGRARPEPSDTPTG